MASAAEQLAANLNFGVLAKATELQKRIWFTLGALIVYRLGTYIPLPGIDPAGLEAFFEQQGGGILGMFDMFAGGALSRMTIFALNIMPYISASIIMQLMTAISPSMEQLKKEGESGRKKINQYTRYLTVFITALQAYGVAIGLESASSGGVAAVIDPGWFFRFTTVITLVGGTLFLMWLGEQITARGVGNGISLIIFAGIVANLPLALASTLELGRTGALSAVVIVGLLVMAVAVIAFIVFIERAQRRILVQYPKRQRGNKMFGGESSHLPLKINTPGVIPPIFASSLLLLPVTIANFGGATGGGAAANTAAAETDAGGAAGEGWMGVLNQVMETAGSFVTDLLPLLGHGQPLYMALYAGLIIFFAFFYTAVVFNPEDTADNLKKYGGFVPGIRPGKNTAEYLDYVLTRLTAVGALYLVAISVMPEYLIAEVGVPFYFGGTSLLIVVTVTMDTVAQIQSHLLAHQYEGLIKKSKLRGKRG
ncbi:preprotein translocase subunit SecY [uncultured Rhodospira sp.]|mgnify:CR=1 FL=1|uniref:preprotein translocase subunit SecY n=1 Tax=uncultured Rhodospira sp. TaxID=1936189 RepID=UPI00261E35C1|nr:preprotein translocase subunit SecY [uncultured Rhodospira sp.]